MKTKKLTKTQLKECLRFWFGKLYIRLRDTDKNGWGTCISSGVKLYWTEGQAGHYLPNGLCKIHTWNPNNVHLQSFRDNVKLHGNLARYRPAIINKIGEEKVVAMEDSKNELRQRRPYELEEMVRQYRIEVIALTATKSSKLQQEIFDYIKKNSKKYREILY